MFLVDSFYSVALPENHSYQALANDIDQLIDGLRAEPTKPDSM